MKRFSKITGNEFYICKSVCRYGDVYNIKFPICKTINGHFVTFGTGYFHTNKDAATDLKQEDFYTYLISIPEKFKFIKL